MSSSGKNEEGHPGLGEGGDNQANTRVVGATEFAMEAHNLRMMSESNDAAAQGLAQDAQDYQNTAETMESLGKLSGTDRHYRESDPNQVEVVEQVEIVAEMVHAESIGSSSLGRDSLEATDHTSLRETISSLVNVTGCVQFYENNQIFRQLCLGAIGKAQNEYIMSRRDNGATESVPALREQWAREWAEALAREDATAKYLNDCRKTSLLFLYKVCDLCFLDPDDFTSYTDELLAVFEIRRIDELLFPCLVMDRANSLYNMTIRSTGELGLGWYSKYNADEYTQTFQAPLNPRGHTVNKRLWWVTHIPDYKDDPTIQHLMKPAVPERLQAAR